MIRPPNYLLLQLGNDDEINQTASVNLQSQLNRINPSFRVQVQIETIYLKNIDQDMN